jgi:hypothetical protein
MVEYRLSGGTREAQREERIGKGLQSAPFGTLGELWGKTNRGTVFALQIVHLPHVI